MNSIKYKINAEKKIIEGGLLSIFLSIFFNQVYQTVPYDLYQRKGAAKGGRSFHFKDELKLKIVKNVSQGVKDEGLTFEAINKGIGEQW